MKKLNEEFLNSKRVQNYANKRNIKIVTGFSSEDDTNSKDYILNVSLYFIDLKPNQTEDDSISYRIDSQGLFYENNHQVKGLTDLPYWIEDYDGFKALINYISEKGE